MHFVCVIRRSFWVLANTNNRRKKPTTECGSVCSWSWAFLNEQSWIIFPWCCAFNAKIPVETSRVHINIEFCFRSLFSHPLARSLAHSCFHVSLLFWNWELAETVWHITDEVRETCGHSLSLFAHKTRRYMSNGRNEIIPEQQHTKKEQKKKSEKNKAERKTISTRAQSTTDGFCENVSSALTVLNFQIFFVHSLMVCFHVGFILPHIICQSSQMCGIFQTIYARWVACWRFFLFCLLSFALFLLFRSIAQFEW